MNRSSHTPCYVLRELYCNDCADIENHVFSKLDCFSYQLHVVIEEELEGRSCEFLIQVCTPSWLLHSSSREEVVVGKHKLIVFNSNFQLVKSRVLEEINQFRGLSWEDFLVKFQRFAELSERTRHEQC